MLLEGGVDGDPSALQCVIGRGTYDAWAQDDMAPCVAVDQGIHNFHGHCRKSVDLLGGAFYVRCSQVWEYEVVPTSTIHGLIVV